MMFYSAQCVLWSESLPWNVSVFVDCLQRIRCTLQSSTAPAEEARRCRSRRWPWSCRRARRRAGSCAEAETSRWSWSEAAERTAHFCCRRSAGPSVCGVARSSSAANTHTNTLINTARSFVTLDHKTSHKGPFLEIEIYASSESWINKLSIDVCYKFDCNI